MVAWESLVEGLPDGVLKVDAGGVVRFANRAASALLGYAAEELVNAPLSQLVPERLRGEAAPLPRSWRIPREASEVRRFVAPVRFRKGLEIEVEWSLSAADHGDVLVVLRPRPPGPLERPSSDEAAALRILRLVFDHVPIGVFHFDERGVVTACNDRFVEILGSTRQRIIGLDLGTLPNLEIGACVRSALAGRASRFEGDYHAVTGDRVTPVRVDFEPILDEDGGSLGGVALAEDVSERKDAERRAAQAERLASLGTLAASVVHELQNPLAFVVASVDLALRALGAARAEGEALADLDRLRVPLENARDGAWRVATIVRDLKAFARSDEELRRPLDIHGAIQVARVLAQHQLGHRAELRMDLLATHRVRASEPRLVQLVLNLLLNAGESVPVGDASRNLVTVSTRDEGDQVLLAVEDTGRGIPPGVREHLFEPFVTDKPGGMGLGLAICHGIVTSLGGTIVAHAGAACGARFEVRFPATEAPATLAREPATTLEASRPAGRRVLVVDDEERLAETIRMALSPPHDVEICTRGRDALDKLRAGGVFDVVLCDLMMPDLSGPELYRQVRAVRPELAQRFVFLTGGAFTDETRDFLHGVPNARLEKPFELEVLEAVVRETASTGGGD